MASPYRVSIENLRSVANASITNSYLALGTPLSFPSRIVAFTNTTDADMLISNDGTNDKLIVPKGTAKLYDLTTNKRASDEDFSFAAKTQFYVKYVTAPSSGSIYLETFFGDWGS